MAAVLEPGVDDHTAIMASIGHICVQWALLEHNLLAVLSAIEGISTDRAALVFAGLDMRPRLCKAIDLAEFHKIHQPLIRRLRSLRSAIDKSKAIDRRNRAIHGVHRPSGHPHRVILMMPRLKGAAREEEWSVMDLYNLGLEIQTFGNETWSIFQDYGAWKFGKHRPENRDGQLVTARPGVWFKIKQYLSTRRDHIRRQFYLLKHWS